MPSQLMPAYRRRSLFRWRLFRRLAYGRGHGIHSPLAYASVYSLLRPYSGYYLDDEEIAEVMTPDEWIWFRMAARLRPSETRYALSEEGLFRAIEKHAFTSSFSNGPILMVTDDRGEAEKFFRENPESPLRVILYTGIRRDRRSEIAFLAFLEGIRQGIVLDYFDGALIFKSNQALYYYRTTL